MSDTLPQYLLLIFVFIKLKRNLLTLNACKKISLNFVLTGDPLTNKSSINQKRLKNSSTANTTGKAPKKIAKEVKKTPARKHPLHACDTLTQNLNFLASVPVGLTTVDGRSEENSPAKSFLPDVVSSSLCRECKVPDFPSKKVWSYLSVWVLI